MDASKTWPYPGARWWKFDFHTHTPASTDTDWFKNEVSITPEEWLLRFMAAKVDCVAVTDHNSGAWVDALKAEYARMQQDRPPGFRELAIFPGIELSVNGGVHLLAVFDPARASTDIAELKGAAGFHGTSGDTDAVTDKAFGEVLDAILKADALAIPAHADKKKGLLYVDPSSDAKATFDATTLRRLCETDRILAMEVVDRSAPKPQVYIESKCSWTEVLGSDWHGKPSDPSPGDRFTWVKMPSSPTLDGLRLALHDGASISVRRSDDPEPFDPFAVPAHFIEKVEIAHARFMGKKSPVVLELSPFMNAIVGGRGTGKSTVVHALRLAYRREKELEALPDDNEAHQTFERFTAEPKDRNDPRGALDYKGSRKTRITVDVRREGVRHRLHWRQDGEGSIVDDYEEPDFVPSQSQSTAPDRFELRIFSQGQIAALAGEDDRALLAVIDEGAKATPLKEELAEAETGYLALRARIRDLDRRLGAREKLELAQRDVKRKLGAFEGKDHAEVLKTYQLRMKQRREVDRQLEAARALAQRLEAMSDEFLPEDPPEELFSEADDADSAALSLIRRLHEDVRERAKSVRAAALSLAETVASLEAEPTLVPWRAELARVSERYGAFVEALRERGVGDPNEYGKLVQEGQRIDSELERLASLTKEREKLREDARSEHENARRVRRDVTERRRAFLTTRLSDNPYVRIRVRPYGRAPIAIERSLREALGVPDERFRNDILELDEDDKPTRGVLVGLINALSEDADAETVESKLEELVKRLWQVARGKGDLGANFTKYLEKRRANEPELIDRLMLWAPEDSLTVEYSQHGNGRDFRPIEQGSAGQRAAAMLAFLLAHGNEPLVLDQPEDDLDNQLIYDLVVKQIRENKLRRQLIIVTHNPNIVVNGDAEMIHVLDFGKGQCRRKDSGSLQEREIREEVCRVMEGGREAFQRRYRRLARGT